ncbi:MAG: hypothetical protein ABI233_07810 [Chthoniobacterales bacterium]
MLNDETLIHPDQPRFLLSAWMWAVTLCIFFGVIVAITFGAMHRGSTYEADRATARSEKFKTAHEEWEKTANSYGWVDKAKGVAHIPVTRAMELELKDLQARKPAPAGPIATPAAAAVPVSETGASQPANPPVTAPPETSPTPKPVSVEGLHPEIRGQPAAAANPPNVPAGTQPGASATPAAKPNSQTEVPPVTPTATPVQHAPGTPLPVRGNGQMPPPTPKPNP